MDADAVVEAMFIEDDIKKDGVLDKDEIAKAVRHCADVVRLVQRQLQRLNTERISLGHRDELANGRQAPTHPSNISVLASF